MWAGDGRPDVRAPGSKTAPSGQDPGPRAGRGWVSGSARRGLPFSLSICVWTPRTNGIKTKQNPSPVIQTEPVLAGQVDRA